MVLAEYCARDYKSNQSINIKRILLDITNVGDRHSSDNEGKLKFSSDFGNHAEDKA